MTDKGAYLLIIELKKQMEISVGALGRKEFARGFYVYVGSALSGFDARIRRHLRKEKKIFWHIDYLLEKAEVACALVYPSKRKTECRLARKISALADDSIPRFGSSDCRCGSHLFHFKRNPVNILPQR